MRRLLPTTLTALVFAPAANAETMVLLPSLHPTVPSVLKATPSTATTEVRWPRRIDSNERVLVDVDAAGRPFLVHVVQRLVVQGLGDYTFLVPAPVTDVRRAAGSQSDPGLRRNAVVWAGFSPRRRVLAADLTLRRDQAVFSALPLRVSLRSDGASQRLVLVNASSDRIQTFSARASQSELRQAFALMRQDISFGAGAPDRYLEVRGHPRSLTVSVEAPIRVRGAVLAGKRTMLRFDRTLGDERPRRVELPVPSALRGLRVRLTATPVLPRRLLAGPPSVDRLVRARLTIARAALYGAFVPAPDPHGEANAVYEYRTAARASQAAPKDEGGGGGVPAAAWILVAVLGAAGLAVVWAHS